MKAYIVIDVAGYTDVFIGNGDELTSAAVNGLAGRVRKLGGKFLVRNVEQVSELREYVEDLEAMRDAEAEAKRDERTPTDSERADWAAEDKHDLKKEGG